VLQVRAVVQLLMLRTNLDQQATPTTATQSEQNRLNHDLMQVVCISVRMYKSLYTHITACITLYCAVRRRHESMLSKNV
jgi:hypothetical protein